MLPEGEITFRQVFHRASDKKEQRGLVAVTKWEEIASLRLKVTKVNAKNPINRNTSIHSIRLVFSVRFSFCSVMMEGLYQ